MQVRHGYDNDRFSIDTVNYPVWETGQQATTQPRLYLRARHRESHGPPSCPVQFVKKLLSRPCRLLVVPSHRVIELPLGQEKKA